MFKKSFLVVVGGGGGVSKKLLFLNSSSVLSCLYLRRILWNYFNLRSTENRNNGPSTAQQGRDGCLIFWKKIFRFFVFIFFFNFQFRYFWAAKSPKPSTQMFHDYNKNRYVFGFWNIDPTGWDLSGAGKKLKLPTAT